MKINIKEMMKSKKAIQQLTAVGIGIVIFAVALALGALILAEFQEQTTSGSVAYNITESGLGGLDTMGTFIGIIAITLIAAFIIFVLVRQFRTGGGGVA